MTTKIKILPDQFVFKQGDKGDAAYLVISGSFNVERDGTMKGLDIDIYKKLNNLELTVPILIAGGASSPDDFAKALSNDNIQGVVGGSIFSLSQYTPKTIRSFCEKKGINMSRCISRKNQ